MTKKEFATRFLNVFAKNISNNELKKFNIGTKSNQCLWNLFGHKLVHCLQGNDAKKEYDNISKDEAIEIHYENNNFGDKETRNLSSCHYTAKDIESSGLIEFYIIGKDFNWCYVVTHAGDMAGPYFCYKH